MKKIIMSAVLVGSLFVHVAHADTMKSLVRISCVPETGLLDIEFRNLHDSVAIDTNGHARKEILVKAGFHDPHDLNFSCDLGGNIYQITAEQDPTSNKICGADPEVSLTVTRAGEKFVSHVVFGTSCNQIPSIARITIGDGPNSWRGRETQVCYSRGRSGESNEPCDWTFGKPAQFEKRFPIDQDRIRRIVDKQEPR